MLKSWSQVAWEGAQPLETEQGFRLYQRTAGSPVTGLGEKTEILYARALLCVLTGGVVITDVFCSGIANGSQTLGNQSWSGIGRCKSELHELKVWYQETEFPRSPSSLFHPSLLAVSSS